MPTTPIINEDRPRRLWFAEEVFTGPLGTGEYVPNVNDGVLHWTTGFSKVIAVDGVTHLSTLEPVNFNATSGGVSENTLLSTGPNPQSEAYRVYINSAVTPAVMAFDSRLRLYGSDASYVKLFLGTDTTVTGHVLSAIYNISNVLLSENIPLELVGAGAIAIKTPEVAWSIEPVATGEVVTAVVYSATNIPLSIIRMTAVATNFVHSADDDRAYITAIELLSPFLSLTDNHLLEYPVNLLLQSGSLQGKLTYSDGSTLTLPIDGSRFQLMGMDRFLPNEEGQRISLILKYNLQPGEYGYGVSSPSPAHSILEDYNLVVVSGLAEYNVKLFVVPRWVGGTTGWTLEYYLYSLSRDVIYNVSAYIEYITGSTAFNGTSLGNRQQFTVAVELSSISGSFLSYRYLQTFAIQLVADGVNNLAPTHWIIEYQTGVFYGSGLTATSVADPGNPAHRRVNISMGFTTVSEWLDHVYYPVLPMRSIVEVLPPTPTHVRVNIGATWLRVIPIADAIQNIDGIVTSTAIGTIVRLEFFRAESTDLELGVASFTIRT